MKKELRDSILAYNKRVAVHKDKASDMDVLIAAFAELPPGQLKKILSEDVLAVFAKYGIQSV